MNLGWAKYREECADLIVYQSAHQPPTESIYHPTLVAPEFFQPIHVLCMEIRLLIPPPWPLLAPLLETSSDEGFQFLIRLEREFQSEEVRFDATGEALLRVRSKDQNLSAWVVSLATRTAMSRVPGACVTFTYSQSGAAEE